MIYKDGKYYKSEQEELDEIHEKDIKKQHTNKKISLILDVLDIFIELLSLWLK